MVSAKTFITAAASVLTIPLASAAFDPCKPFTLHTEVTKGPEDFNNFYLTAFHVGAAEQTVVGTTNVSRSIGWVLDDNFLQQPLSVSSGNLPPYNLTLLAQAPYMSSAPSGYDYISLSYSGSTSGFSFAASNASTAELEFSASGNATEALNFQGFALCHVNGTAPYFTVGPQYQLLWKTGTANSSYTDCADVELIGHNIDE